MNNDLYDFVRDALGKGASRAQIGEALISAGWPKAEAAAAIDGFADISFPIPVPRPRPYLSAREVFIYGIQFLALYISAYALGRLFFNFIDRAFPDQLAANTYRSVNADIRWSVSFLIVAFPLFLWMHNYTNRLITQDPTKRASKPRKWVTYLTLLFATMCLICDVGTLVYYTLGGELTIRFLLKVITIGILAGGIFAYFITDQRKDEIRE
jgi:Domain of unknown function (DUF5671)